MKKTNKHELQLKEMFQYIHGLQKYTVPTSVLVTGLDLPTPEKWMKNNGMAF